MSKDTKAKFKDIFWIMSYYLVQPIEKYDFLKLLREKRGLNK